MKLERCYNGLKQMPTNSNVQDEMVWKTYSPYNGLRCKRTYYCFFMNMGRTEGWKKPTMSAWSRNFD